MYNKGYKINLIDNIILLPFPKLGKLWLPHMPIMKEQFRQLFSNPLLHQFTLKKEIELKEDSLGKNEEDVISEDSPEAKIIPKMNTKPSTMLINKEKQIGVILPKNQPLSSIHTKNKKLDEKLNRSILQAPHSISASVCSNCNTYYEYGSTRCSKCGNLERFCGALYLKKDKMLVRYWFKLIGQDLYCKIIIRL
jgi:hypothetical protein